MMMSRAGARERARALRARIAQLDERERKAAARIANMQREREKAEKDHEEAERQRKEAEENVASVSESELDRLISLREAAEILGCHPDTLRKMWRNRTFIPPLRVGKLVKWRRRDVLGWLESGGRYDD